MKKTTSIFVFVIVVSVATSIIGAEKVVVVPLSSSGPPKKLWGEGRERTSVTVVGSVNGIAVGRSKTIASWDGAAAACPENTWVCSSSEIEQLETLSAPVYVNYVNCIGGGAATTREYWVSDDSSQGRFGTAMYLFDNMIPGVYRLIEVTNIDKCEYRPVWCCSK